MRDRNSCGPRGSGAHVLEEGLDAILRLQRLARDHVGARDEAFGVVAEVDEDAVAVDALDDAADQRVDAVLEQVDDLRALCLAHLLHHDLLGLLGSDAAEGHRLHRLLDESARLGILAQIERVIETQLAIGILELGGIVGEHLPATEGVVVAGLAVDGDAHVPFLAMLLARGRCERRFQRFEDDFLVDALLVGDGIDDHQNFFVHHFFHPSAFLGRPVRREAGLPDLHHTLPSPSFHPRSIQFHLHRPTPACRCIACDRRALPPAPRAPARPEIAGSAAACAASDPAPGDDTSSW